MANRPMILLLMVPLIASNATTATVLDKSHQDQEYQIKLLMPETVNISVSTKQNLLE